MPKKADDEWLPDDRGRYVRKVGYWINKSGKRILYPFKFALKWTPFAGPFLDRNKVDIVFELR